ncbi:MAG: transposase, partial [Acidihalobacter sp.]|uniref:transposase n=1 Tax=Acidihalobacter sp. TaxID=1872108 RepID=UPI00307D2BDA
MAQGPNHVRKALAEHAQAANTGLPELARSVFADLHERLVALEAQLAGYDRQLHHLAQAMPEARRLMQVPGVGPITATALVASTGDIHQFANARQFAAWLGLVPRH